jgi:hypothetical protein
MKRTLSLLIISLFLIAITAGCMDRSQVKQDFTAALAKHTDMQTYSFSGSAQIEIHPSDLETPSKSLSADLIQLLMNRTITWEGIAATSPLQLEATIHLAASGPSTPYEIPLLIKDNMMYIHIPMLNSENQYMEIDFVKLNEITGKSNNTTMEQIGLAGQLFTGLVDTIVGSIDPKYFSEHKLEQQAGNRELIATIKTDQTETAVKLWLDSAPLIMDQLVNAGYMPDFTASLGTPSASDDPQKQLEAYKNEIELHKPVIFSTIIDDQGFMRELKLNVDMTRTKTDVQAARQWKIDILSKYDDINQAPAFKRDIPEDVLPFTELLKVMTTQP